MTTVAIGYELDNLIDEPRTIARESRWFIGARVVLLTILFGSPLAFGAVLPWGWGVITALAGIALCCWGLACVETRSLTVFYSWLHVLALVLASLAASQLFANVTVDAIATREALLKLATDLIILWLASTLFTVVSETSREQFGLWGSVYGFGIAWFAIIQSLANPTQIYWLVSPRWGGYIFGPYVNHNHYAGLMEMVLPIMLAFALCRGLHKPGGRLLVFTAVIVFLSVMLSGSRSGLVSVLAELLIFAVVLAMRLPRRRHMLVGAAVTLCAASMLSSWLANDDVVDRLRSTISSPEATYGERRNMVFDAIAVLRRFPLTGTGLGTFATVYPQYQSFATDQQIDHAHNDYAELLAETGIPGAVLLAIAMIVFGAYAWRNLKGPLSSSADWLRLGATIGCCGILIHSFTDFNLHLPANAAWFAVCLGIATTSRTCIECRLSAKHPF